MIVRADSRLAASQWETSLQSNTISHWLGGNLELTLISMVGMEEWDDNNEENVIDTLASPWAKTTTHVYLLLLVVANTMG